STAAISVAAAGGPSRFNVIQMSLRLTLKQATRFWGMDEQTCARSLDYLVEIGLLARVEQGTYRLSDGAVKFPSLGMAKASLGARWPALLRDAS
ncbi:MAG: hypothetical protein ABW292_05880, partial [Vicinamibacterales bacterium]